jgi:hypothetical protein
MSFLIAGTTPARTSGFATARRADNDRQEICVQTMN